VWLTLAGVEGAAQIWLNGRSIAKLEIWSEPLEFEVTPSLQVRNELVAEIEGTGGQAGLWGEVALEVRCTAYLRGVQWWTAPLGEAVQLHVAGELVGVSERPLELYALVDGKTLIYTMLEPTSSGTPFRVTSDKLLGQPRQVRIELVDRATIWFVVEGAL
jgi:hypothetical protein